MTCKNLGHSASSTELCGIADQISLKSLKTQTVPGLLKYLPSVLNTNLMELLYVMSLEPCNTSQACPQIMDEEGKGQTWSRAVNKKRLTPTWEAVM
jgi:hypothetical protein